MTNKENHSFLLEQHPVTSKAFPLKYHIAYGQDLDEQQDVQDYKSGSTTEGEPRVIPSVSA